MIPLSVRSISMDNFFKHLNTMSNLSKCVDAKPLVSVHNSTFSLEKGLGVGNFSPAMGAI
jgi:hypothetical protein